MNVFFPFQINFSDLARRYGITQKNTGNVTVKKFLKDSGVDLRRFKQLRQRPKPTVRRKLNRMPGGEVSVPVPRTNTSLRSEIMKKIESGEYNMGEVVVPRKYKRVTLSPEGDIVMEEFTVSGRHIPLTDIRVQILKKHEQMGLVRNHSTQHYDAMSPDQLVSRLRELGDYREEEDITLNEMKTRLSQLERTKHFMVWSDQSTIMNHGNILMTVNPLYDPAFLFT